MDNVFYLRRKSNGATYSSYNHHAFYTDSTAGAETGKLALTLLANGYVGIGTTTPQSPLDVSGNLIVSGNIIGYSDEEGVELGMHEIKEKIGENAEINTIFISRINTMRKAEIYKSIYDSSNDYVTSRILWLSGLEEGLNKGSGIDSYDRYIYIHGTHEEGLIGQKASDGCIRMFNKDVVYLFNIVSKGTKVYIKA